MEIKNVSGDPLNSAIAATIRAELTEQKKSMVEISKTTGINYQQVQRILTDERIMTATQLVAICAALKIEVSVVTKKATGRLAK